MITLKKTFQQANCPKETLKEASWEVIEFQNRVRNSNQSLDPNRDAGRSALKLCTQYTEVSEELVQKQRTPVYHVMVMLSNEKHTHKPYALPAQYIRCQTLKDQFVRDLNVKLREEMKSREMKVAG